MRILIIALGRSGGYQLNKWLALELGYKMIHEPIRRNASIEGNNIVVKYLVSDIQNRTDIDLQNWDKIIAVVQELTGKGISEGVSKQLIEKIKKEILDKKLVLETKSKGKSTLVASVAETSSEGIGMGAVAVGSVSISSAEASKSEMVSEKPEDSISQAVIDKKKATFIRNYNKFKSIIEDPTFPKRLQQPQVQTAYDSLLKLREQFLPQFNTEGELKSAITKIEESIVKLQKVLNK